MSGTQIFAFCMARRDLFTELERAFPPPNLPDPAVLSETVHRHLHTPTPPLVFLPPEWDAPTMPIRPEAAYAASRSAAPRAGMMGEMVAETQARLQIEHLLRGYEIQWHPALQLSGAHEGGWQMLCVEVPADCALRPGGAGGTLPRAADLIDQTVEAFFATPPAAIGALLSQHALLDDPRFAECIQRSGRAGAHERLKGLPHFQTVMPGTRPRPGQDGARRVVAKGWRKMWELTDYPLLIGALLVLALIVLLILAG